MLRRETNTNFGKNPKEGRIVRKVKRRLEIILKWILNK
jgi:hypothetical protein